MDILGFIKNKNMFGIKKKIVSYFDESYYYWYVPRKRAKWAKAMYERLANSGQIQHVPNSIKKQIDSRWHNSKIDYRWFDFYYTFCLKYRGEFSDDISLFVPLDFFFCQCEPYFNHPLDGISYSDKNMNDMHFPEIEQPKTILRYIDGLFFDSSYSIISKRDAHSLLESTGQCVIKPATDSGGGKGIFFFDDKKDYDFDSIFTGTKNIIVQELFHQHPSLKLLHEASVNTIRVVSLVWNGQVLILSSVVRMGMNNKQVDNLSAGGMYCGINDQGRLAKNAFANYKGAMDSVYTQHPNSGVVFENYEIPNFDKVIDAIKSVALRYCRIGKMIAWDFSIDERGNPVMIETNMCGVDNSYFQMANGPVFGDLTDQIIEAVKNNPRKTFGIK